MARISLESFDGLNAKERAIASVDLSGARKRSVGLAEELPIPNRKYSNPLRIFFRLPDIARIQAASGLEAFLIRDGDVAIGVATAQVLEPNPVALGPGAVELSYWHDNKEPVRDDDINVTIGKSVVKGLVTVDKWANPSNYPEDPRFWMVTMPADEVKAEVCLASGMIPHDVPQVYNIADENTRRRQLWTAAEQ